MRKPLRDFMSAGPKQKPCSFEPLLIPRALKATAWGRRKPGGRVEVDQMACYAARLLESLTECG
jgi:riboflavin synthase alpha subunit